jgi:hypothetical protein
VGYVDQDVQNGEGHRHGATDDHDATDVADDVAVFLGSASGEQPRATGSAGSGLLGAITVARTRSTVIHRALLRDDLGLELGCPSLLGSGQRGGWARCGTRLGSSGTVPVGMPLARTIRSTSALGHVL